MKKKCLLRAGTVVLTLAMSIPLCLSGCSDKPESSSGPDGSPSENGVSFGGKTLKVAVWYEPEKPSLGQSEAGDAWYYSMEQAMDKYDCAVEWVINPQETHFSKFVQSSLSGEVYADILMCHSWNWVSLIKQELIYPTDTYIDSAPDKEMWAKDLYTYNDQCWALQPASQNPTPTNVFFYNTKMISDLGLESPQELALRSEWTWDKFREYCAAATDPALERYGVACFMLPDMLMTSNGFRTVMYDETDKKYHNGYTYDATKQAGLGILEYIQTLSQVDKSVLGNWPAGQEALEEGEDAFLDGKVLFIYGRNPASMKRMGMTDFAPVTAPLGPAGETVEEYVAAFAFWSLPTNSEFSPEDRAAFWMDAKRTWDESKGDAYYAADIDDVKEEMLAESYNNMSDVEFMLEMGKKIRVLPDLAGSMSIGSVIADDMYGKVIRGESTPAAVIAATDNVIQAKIDSTFNTDV